MKNLEDVKSKLVRAINESRDENLIFELWKMINSQNASMVSESPSIYETEKPMTEEEVEEYFKDEVVVLPQEIVDILKISETQIQNGESHSNEEVEKYFEQWLKD